MNDFESLKALIAPPAWKIGNSFHFFDSVASTNDLLKNSIPTRNLSEGAIFIADEQTTGKGRSGRVWDSPPGVGLWMSMLFEPTFSMEQYFLINIMTAVSVYEALKHAGLRPLLKWPNDVMIGRKKICGILLESITLSDRKFIVVGVGMNINTSFFPDSLQQTATSLFLETQSVWSRKNILEDFLQRINYFYENLDRSIIKIWKSKNTILHHPIQVMTNDTTYAAVATDMADDGALLVESGGKLEKIYAADVSIKFEG